MGGKTSGEFSMYAARPLDSGGNKDIVEAPIPNHDGFGNLYEHVP